MAKTPAKSAPKKRANKAEFPANKDREEAIEYLRMVMKNGEDEQARVLAAIGLAQLSHTHLH